MSQIHYKHPEMQREFTQLDPALTRVVRTMQVMVWEAHRKYLVVTRIKEKKKDDSTHNKQAKPYRFIDIALVEGLDLEENDRIRRALNVFFPYGKEGYQTIPKLTHGTSPHFHIQVR